MESVGVDALPLVNSNAGSAPASVSAAVSAISVPVPACQRRASTAALRRAIVRVLMRKRSGEFRSKATAA